MYGPVLVVDSDVLDMEACAFLGYHDGRAGIHMIPRFRVVCRYRSCQTVGGDSNFR